MLGPQMSDFSESFYPLEFSAEDMTFLKNYPCLVLCLYVEIFRKSRNHEWLMFKSPPPRSIRKSESGNPAQAEPHCPIGRDSHFETDEEREKERISLYGQREPWKNEA